jgi:methylase of polypeptide subunit release factors
MQTRRGDLFTTVRTEGAILPPDLLTRIVARDSGLDGLTADSYHLVAGEKLNEAINRSWNRLSGAWSAFQSVLARLPDRDAAAGPTREKWLLPLYQELGYGRLVAASPVEIEGKAYAISHNWQHAVIHLLGANLDLDRRAPGAVRASPHSLVQEFLNRSDEHLWGFLSNGRRLRILRDNASLTRQAYVEFDLEAMMSGEVYADFALLWLLCHQSRVEAERPAECWLERWSKAAQEQGTRALDQLRGGVEAAIAVLGRGFLSYQGNASLRDRLRADTLNAQDYYRQILRLVYRLLFLFVAEDRDLLHDTTAEPAARERYENYYATDRLRRLAERRRGTQHVDLYRGLSLVMEKLGKDEGCPALALPALGSFLWSRDALADLEGCDLANTDLLEAIRALAFTIDGKSRRAIDYKNLGSEELGSVYESLLELHPEVNTVAGTFELKTTAGHERRTTGSYYTPASLVACLIDSALDPVLAEAARQHDAEAAILKLKVCDPACGSGHFLIAAAHRIAKKLAAVRTGDEEPAPEEVRKAIRDVIGNCIHGVDINPDAVELCKVALWMEALVPGKPLSFLDHHIQCGNSLLGATPALLSRGIPDAAFEPIEGDDKAVCRDYRKQNRDERGRQATMFDLFAKSETIRLSNVAPAVARIEAMGDDSIAALHTKEQAHREFMESMAYEYARLLADAWCAAFVIPKVPVPPLEPRVTLTESTFRKLENNPNMVPREVKDEVAKLAARYHFFHWHLGFLNVFQPKAGKDIAEDDVLGWEGGFDVVLGNPPWERIKIQEQEWFAQRRPDIAKAPNAAARRKMVQKLAVDDPALYGLFQSDRRVAEGESHIACSSSRFPLCGRGDVNTYTLFAELNRQLIGARARVGMVVPPGISYDDTTKHFFHDLMERRSLASFYHFENEEFLFPAVDHRVVFSLLTLAGPERIQSSADFAFFCRRTEHLQDPGRHFTLTADEIRLMNPNTGTCPILRSKRDAEINKAIYHRVPVLIREEDPAGNPWGMSFMAMLHMANDSGLFRTREQLEADCWTLNGNVFHRGEQRYLPLYEAKMVHHFDHRFGTYEGQTESQANQSKLPEFDDLQHAEPDRVSLPWYWVPAEEVENRLEGRWSGQWFLGWRDVCRNTDTRTVISSLLPRSGIGHKFPVMIPCGVDPSRVACLYANLASYVLDYTARQKMGGTSLSYFHLKQFPILPPDSYAEEANWSHGLTKSDWLLARVVELTYTAWDLAAFAHDCGYDGPPFRWLDARRFLIRCEVDAVFFHLYGINHDDAAYILDTFPVVRKKDESAHGEYRTKRVILEIYDQMTEAMRTGVPYRTLLDPPPADPRVAHPRH